MYHTLLHHTKLKPYHTFLNKSRVRKLEANHRLSIKGLKYYYLNLKKDQANIHKKRRP
jgi:hypothetical protein